MINDSGCRMTDSELVEWIRETVREFSENYPQLRWGQCHMISLNQVRPDLYQEITATGYDPFYRDEILVELFKYLKI